MLSLSLPFTQNQKVVVPIGTQQTIEGYVAQTIQELVITVKHVLNGHVEMENGTMIAHPPILIGTVNNQPASYEVSNNLLVANGIPVHSLYRKAPGILVA